jgi:type IV secretory pathway ATPase VirB11/archaellum biosynthesis ATPase
MQWYVVTGRLNGADEDEVQVLQARDLDDAMRVFRERMHQFVLAYDVWVDPQLEAHERVYVSSVVQCGTEEPRILWSVT